MDRTTTQILVIQQTTSASSIRLYILRTTTSSTDNSWVMSPEAVESAMISALLRPSDEVGEP
jgi:hypothetical protein